MKKEEAFCTLAKKTCVWGPGLRLRFLVLGLDLWVGPLVQGGAPAPRFGPLIKMRGPGLDFGTRSRLWVSGPGHGFLPHDLDHWSWLCVFVLAGVLPWLLGEMVLDSHSPSVALVVKESLWVHPLKLSGQAGPLEQKFCLPCSQVRSGTRICGVRYECCDPARIHAQ